MTRPSVISLFAGAGGLDIGLEQAGFRTLFANDVEPVYCETLRQNHRLRSLPAAAFDAWFENVVGSQRCYRKVSPNELGALRERLRGTRLPAGADDPVIAEGCVRSLRAEDMLAAIGRGIGEVDLIAGGPPCQPFSRAGKRQMVDCDSGQLFMEFAGLVDRIRPRFFLFENVKGLVIQKADVVTVRCKSCGRTDLPDFKFREILKAVDEVSRHCAICNRLSEHDVHWQSRRGGSLEIIEREFRRLGYTCHSKVLNAADFGAPQSRERLIIVGSRDNERFHWPEPSFAEANREKGGDLFRPSIGLPPWRTLRDALYQDGHWRYGALDRERAVLWVKNVVRPHDEPVTWSLDRVCPTVGAHQAAKFAIAPDGVPEAQLARQQWHVLGRRQGDTPPVFVEHEYLSDAELLRLQTFPEDWYLHGTRMERAFQIGNAVPPVLARALGDALLEAMELGNVGGEGRRVANTACL